MRAGTGGAARPIAGRLPRNNHGLCRGGRRPSRADQCCVLRRTALTTHSPRPPRSCLFSTTIHTLITFSLQSHNNDSHAKIAQKAIYATLADQPFLFASLHPHVNSPEGELHSGDTTPGFEAICINRIPLLWHSTECQSKAECRVHLTASSPNKRRPGTASGHSLGCVQTLFREKRFSGCWPRRAHPSESRGRARRTHSWCRGPACPPSWCRRRSQRWGSSAGKVPRSSPAC